MDQKIKHLNKLKEENAKLKEEKAKTYEKMNKIQEKNDKLQKVHHFFYFETIIFLRK